MHSSFSSLSVTSVKTKSCSVPRGNRDWKWNKENFAGQHRDTCDHIAGRESQVTATAYQNQTSLSVFPVLFGERKHFVLVSCQWQILVSYKTEEKQSWGCEIPTACYFYLSHQVLQAGGLRSPGDLTSLGIK